MGLIDGLLTLPLAPVRGAVWVIEKVAEQAEADLYDEGNIRRQLEEVQFAYEMGEMGEEEFAEAEDDLVARLEVSRERQRAEAERQEAELLEEPTIQDELIEVLEVGDERRQTEIGGGPE